jgi:hypothetical protein
MDENVTELFTELARPKLEPLLRPAIPALEADVS